VEKNNRIKYCRKNKYPFRFLELMQHLKYFFVIIPIKIFKLVQSITINLNVMKKSSVCLLIFVFIMSFNSLLGQNNSQSKIRAALNKVKTLHSYDIYHLSEVKGEEKSELNLFAIEYSEYNVPNKLTSIQFELNLETNIPGETTTKASSNYYGYIDEDEYPEVTLAITNLMEDLNDRDEKNTYGSITYITKDRICFGYILTHEKEFAFVELVENNIKIRADFSNPLKFFQALSEQLDIATKKLYLPENAEKLKNAKKSKQGDAKDVIIDDI